MTWKTPNGESTSYETIIEEIKETVKSTLDHRIIIGVDSQPRYQMTVVVKVITIITNDSKKKRTYFYEKTKVKNSSPDMYSRIIQECMSSIELALRIRSSDEWINSLANIEVHLDISSPESKTKTSRISNMLQNMVRGHNIENVCIKPDSWVASSIADRYTKTY